MRQRLHEFSLRTSGPGAHDLTSEVVSWTESTGIAEGLLTLYVRHTSASLMVQENYDPEVMRAGGYLDQEENDGRYTLLEGVHLIWKRCHSWGNVLGSQGEGSDQETYCAAPYEQFVIQWNGDAVNCCIDYEGRTKVANVFKESIEAVWTGTVLTQRKRDMLGGRLLDVCAKCLGVKPGPGTGASQ